MERLPSMTYLQKRTKGPRWDWVSPDRTPMPSSSTLRQGSSSSSSFSLMSSSILRGLPPYRWWEQIPDITLLKYGRIIDDNDDYDDLMAILYQQTNLYSKTITMWHLWITAQKLRGEVWWSSSAAAWLPTPYYPAPEEIRPLEPVKWSPTPPPTSPPLGEQGNPIIVEDSNEELDRWDNDFYTAESTFSTPVSFLLHCQECTDWRYQYFEHPQYICNHHYRWAPGHWVSDCTGSWSQWLQP